MVRSSEGEKIVRKEREKGKEKERGKAWGEKRAIVSLNLQQPWEREDELVKLLERKKRKEKKHGSLRRHEEERRRGNKKRKRRSWATSPFEFFFKFSGPWARVFTIHDK